MKSIFPFFLNFISSIIVLFFTIFQLLLAYAGFPIWNDVCILQKFGPFEIKEQHWKLAESHQDYRMQATFEIVSDIYLSFPYFGDNSKNCIR
ncbi:hypothetical protein [Leptospira ryugenii]|uniref:hypothetical protein n=1 Tax=Leptospira ryugenii TaxID=1917863 RepID=UPI00107FA09B|nr:hypothetical protein [Leptospira ryugenii]